MVAMILFFGLLSERRKANDDQKDEDDAENNDEDGKRTPEPDSVAEWTSSTGTAKAALIRPRSVRRNTAVVGEVSVDATGAAAVVVVGVEIPSAVVANRKLFVVVKGERFVFETRLDAVGPSRRGNDKGCTGCRRGRSFLEGLGDGVGHSV